MPRKPQKLLDNTNNIDILTHLRFNKGTNAHRISQSLNLSDDGVLKILKRLITYNLVFSLKKKKYNETVWFLTNHGQNFLDEVPYYFKLKSEIIDFEAKWNK